MEKVLQSFKDLYKSDNVIKRHLMLCLIMFLPALMGAYSAYIDKETPKNLLLPFGIAIFVLLIFSIIPLICLGGYYIKFLKNKLNGELGIPAFEEDILKTGFKAIPMFIVWGFYGTVISVILVGLIVAPVIGVVLSKASLGIPLTILCVLLFIVWLIFVLALGFVIYPFFSYVFIEYAAGRNEHGRLYNPLLLIDYMKKDFKETIIIALKYLVAGLVANAGVMVVALFCIIFVVCVTFIASIFTVNADLIEYHPVVVFISTLIYAVNGIARMYANKMVLFATNSNYIEIYKNKMITTGMNE